MCAVMSCIITLSSGTFHVQNVTTRLFQNKQCVTCWFAQGTTAIGCHISFTDSKGNLVQETVARRQGNTLSAGDCAGDLPPGVYRVLASDINSSDVVDHRTAAIGKSSKTEKIILPSCISTNLILHMQPPDPWFALGCSILGHEL